MHVPCNFREWLKINLTKKIKIFQSDGGGEFSNRKFAKHLHECGILHQMSYLGTPEQNGVAKRKHRHIVELGLTMMIAFNVPKRFWVEAFTIVIFEINRLPRNNLGINSPFSLLYGQEPKYSSLRVFDCRCFPYLRSYSSDKLKPRSLPCVFLGYSDQYRGYKCLHPPTHKISLGMLYLMKILYHILILIHCIVVVLFRGRLLLLVIGKLQVHLHHPNSRKTRCHSASQIPPILVIFQHMITLGYYMMRTQRHWLMITLSALK